MKDTKVTEDLQESTSKSESVGGKEPSPQVAKQDGGGETAGSGSGVLPSPPTKTELDLGGESGLKADPLSETPRRLRVRAKCLLRELEESELGDFKIEPSGEVTLNGNTLFGSNVAKLIPYFFRRTKYKPRGWKAFLAFTRTLNLPTPLCFASAVDAKSESSGSSSEQEASSFGISATSVPPVDNTPVPRENLVPDKRWYYLGPP